MVVASQEIVDQIDSAHWIRGSSVVKDTVLKDEGWDSYGKANEYLPLVEVGQVCDELASLLNDYKLQCQRIATPVHNAVKRALVDTAAAVRREGLRGRAWTLDLSVANPPLNDQDLRPLCIALMQSAENGFLRRMKLLKLSDNKITSQEAARAILLFMCGGNGELELDLSRNHKLHDIDTSLLQLKKDLQHMRCDQIERRRPGLRSLVLDGCDIKKLSAESCILLHGIKSLSLSHTGISNLWSAATALQKLNLKSLAFQERRPRPAERKDALRHNQSDETNMKSSAVKLRLESPLCREKGYREFLIHKLPTLEVLDGLEVVNEERLNARTAVEELFHTLDRSVNRRLNEILRSRETGERWRSSRIENGVGSSRRTKEQELSECVLAKTIDNPHTFQACRAAIRPRQFEYNPLVPEWMIVGSLDGGVHHINHETGRELGSLQGRELGNLQIGTDTMLALCWTNRNPNYFLSGSGGGVIQLFDASKMQNERGKALKTSYPNFDFLTSLHINNTDERFVVSGYPNDVAVYDLETAKVTSRILDCHSTHVNVVKFANTSPHIFASSSFDKDVKLWDIREPSYGGKQTPVYTRSSSSPNVMVCFSPDDRYLLASAVNNEVKQYLTCDGRLLHDCQMRQHHTAALKYTRSYYLKGGEYFVSGSCPENSVRIFNSTDGKLLRELEIESWRFNDVSKEDRDGSIFFVQSLRGDPHHPLNFSVLMAWMKDQECKASAILKVDLLRSAEDETEL